MHLDRVADLDGVDEERRDLAAVDPVDGERDRVPSPDDAMEYEREAW